MIDEFSKFDALEIENFEDILREWILQGSRSVKEKRYYCIQYFNSYEGSVRRQLAKLQLILFLYYISISVSLSLSVVHSFK